MSLKFSLSSLCVSKTVVLNELLVYVECKYQRFNLGLNFVELRG